VPEPIAIAGAGRIGQSLGRLLRDRGETIAAVASRSPERAAGAAVFVAGGAKAAIYAELPQHAGRSLIAVPDHAIGTVARVLAAAGVACGTLHPLQTVASPEEGVRVLPGVAFAIDGAPEAAAWAGRLVVLLDGLALHVPAASRPLYHAAAMMASNYVTALIAPAVMLMKEAGVDEAAARLALAPLARASVANAFRLGPSAALAKAPAAVAGLYRAAGLATLEIARRRGLAEVEAGAIEELLRQGERCD